MSKLYSSPLRVYLIVAILALAGINAGLNLPISLFPNSSKPDAWVEVPYGESSAEEFMNTYGRRLESRIRSISVNNVKIDKIYAYYNSSDLDINVKFEWGASPTDARRELESVVNAFAAQFPKEIRDNTEVHMNSENSGFFAASYYSDIRELGEVHSIVEPILSSALAGVEDASNPVVWNPSQKEIRLILRPDVMATLGIFPRDVERAVRESLGSKSGGSVTIGTSRFTIQMPRMVEGIEDLSRVSIPTPHGKTIFLTDVAHIDFRDATESSRIFKTSGAPSVIVFASPKPGGNVKKMSEDIIEIIDRTAPDLPKDIKYKVLVDPSEFIRASISNVVHEVVLAALIAVAILFLFVGSFRNVATAAIEIPLSMVLAFILMRVFDMNLNLISLGGLALSAGMNVDASVVVMENIFRHFKGLPSNLSPQKRLEVVIGAVNEVKFPVIASTIASLVVFIPLTFTSALSYAILGDLAKAVVFSHGFSAFVALILVPTIRLHLMDKTNETPQKSIIDGQLTRLENFYSRCLEKFISGKRLKLATYAGLGLLLGLLFALVLPQLPKEIVGKPDTDWLILQVKTRGNTLKRQMEAQAEKTEMEMTNLLGDSVQYTFMNLGNTNRAHIMARLNNKKDMDKVWKQLEEHFQNTPLIRYNVFPWNPSELPIPDPSNMELWIRGNNYQQQVDAAREIVEALKKDKEIFARYNIDPNIYRTEGITIEPRFEQWAALSKAGATFVPSDLSDMVRVATVGKNIGELPVEDTLTSILMSYPNRYANNLEEISFLPVGANNRVVALKSLASVSIKKVPPRRFHDNEQSIVAIHGRVKKGNEHLEDEKVAESKRVVNEWVAKNAASENPISATVTFQEPAIEMIEALNQLGTAVLISIGLILFTLLFQFGSLAPALLVLVSVPLGIIGVIVALFVFKSTLSLNSVLGVILLNGIAVANSIILVDFILRLVKQGRPPKEAALEAARKRLRPILITSLTTILGMFPIALGMGDGGKILQPLGITVSAGLWVSTCLTLFIVPTLQVSYLEWAEKNPHPFKSFLTKLGYQKLQSSEAKP